MNFITDLIGLELFTINPRVIGIDSANTGEPNHVVLMDLQFWDWGTAAFGTSILMPVQFVDGKAYVNLTRFFDMNIDVPGDEFDGFEVNLCAESFWRYKVSFSEYYGDNLETVQNSISLTSEAVKGGVEVIRARNYSLQSSIVDEKQFFTQQPLDKEITREQPEFMYFFHNVLFGDSSTMRADVTVFFSDGSEHFVSIVTRMLGRGLYRVTSGFGPLDLAQFETEDRQVLSYDFDMYSNFGDESTQVGKIAYSVNYDTFNWEQRYFIFENNIGGLDTIRTDGKGQENIEVIRQVLRKVETPFLDSSAHTHSVQNSYQNSRKVSTGWIDANVREWLKTFFISPSVWLYLPDTNGMVPVTIGDRSAVIHKDDDSLQDISFSYNFVESQAI